nr:hypothetical protein CFP56_17208 [Quercus suber]
MLNLRTGSRGFSSGSGFGFRGRRARDSDTLASEKWDLGFVKLTGAAAEAAAKEGKPLAYDDLHDLRQMLIPPSLHRCNYINNTIQEFVSKVGEDYEYREHHEYLRAYYCGLNKGD